MFFRMIFGLPGAAFITALLFLAMGWMIRTQESVISDPPPPVESITFKEPKPKPVTPPRTPDPQTPDAPEITFDKSTNPGTPIDFDDMTDPVIEGDRLNFDMTGTQPTIRIPPAYPENCRARGAQGVVLVEFDVTAEGTVVNPRVIASENSCLDRAAMQTISKWKYTPKTDSSGRAVPQRGLRQSFNFQLTDG